MSFSLPATTVATIALQPTLPTVHVGKVINNIISKRSTQVGTGVYRLVPASQYMPTRQVQVRQRKK